MLTAGLSRTEILKSLLVWTVPAFAPMSLLWFGRLLERRVRYRLQIGVAKATRECTIQNLTQILPREPMRVIKSF